MNYLRTAALVIVLSVFSIAQLSLADAVPANGKLRCVDGHCTVWAGKTGEWLSVEAFWRQYAAANGGSFRGETPEYPPYEKVGEHDTLLVDSGRGLCLMEFFHSRWRRANDVRRWDPGFSEVGGCPYVFD
jgi:hypothetical protein